MTITKNIGKKDRIIRAVCALVLFAAILLFDNKIIQWVLFLASLFCVYEAVTGWCGLYQFLGKNTCPVAPVVKE